VVKRPGAAANARAVIGYDPEDDSEVDRGGESNDMPTSCGRKTVRPAHYLAVLLIASILLWLR
jgi:hypothetical protein